MIRERVRSSPIRHSQTRRTLHPALGRSSKCTDGGHDFRPNFSPSAASPPPFGGCGTAIAIALSRRETQKEMWAGPAKMVWIRPAGRCAVHPARPGGSHDTAALGQYWPQRGGPDLYKNQTASV